MSFNHTFHWPSGPNEVIVTGTFDEWSSSLPLVKTSKGDFEVTFPLKSEKPGDKVLFKFVVDGKWVTSTEYQTSTDDGIENNVLYLDELKAAESKGSKIPEAGGLATSSNKENVSTTVLPSSEGEQKTLGEPGIVVPTNASEIKEFSEVRDVDAKALNEKLNAEEAKTTVLPSSEGQQQTSGEPGIAIPANASEIKEFSEVRDVDAKALNEKLNSGEKKKQTKLVKIKKVIRRNKKTGEETVISSEPITDDVEANGSGKTLDPKKKDDIPEEEATGTESTEIKEVIETVPETATETSTEPKSEKTEKTEKTEESEKADKVVEPTTTEKATEPAAVEPTTSEVETKKETASKKETPAEAPATKEVKKEKKGFLRKLKKIFD